MTAPRPILLGSSQGLTLLETVAVLLIVAILAVPLAGVASRLIVLPVEWQENLGAMRDARQVLHLVASDARQAECFTGGSDEGGEHGTFTWTDYTETPVRKFSVLYYLDTEGNLMREETVDDSPPQTIDIGRVEKFEIQPPDDRLIRASVRNPSRAAEGSDAPSLEIAAMMRPDDPSDC